MNILLLQPPLSLSERYEHSTGDIGGHLPPLGIASLAAYVREKGYFVSIVDGNVVGKSLSELAGLICEGTKVVGLTALTSNFHRAKFLAEKIRKTFPHVLIVLG